MKRTKPIGRWLQAYLPGKRKISEKQARYLGDKAVVLCALAKLDVECAVARLVFRGQVDTPKP